MGAIYDRKSKAVKPVAPNIRGKPNFPNSVDRDEAARFLGLLDGESETFIFASFDDDEERTKNKSAGKLIKPAHKRSDLDGALSWMTKRQLLGTSVCYTVQEMTGAQRRKNEIHYYRAIFAELDKGIGVPWPIEPSIIYETSPGRSHVLFLVNAETPIAAVDFEGMQERIVCTYGGDPGAWDAARALRLPGTWNLKTGRGREPYLVRITHESGARYSRADLMAAFPPVPHEKPSVKRQAWGYEVPQGLTEYQAALSGLSADCSREEWLNVGFALHYESGGSAEALAMWDAWSAQSGEKYVANECAYYWRNMKNRGKSITGKTIFWLTRQYGWRPTKKTIVAKPVRPLNGKAEMKTPAAPLKMAAPPPSDPPPSRERPIIMMEGGKLHEITQAAEKHLIAANIPFYTRDKNVCRPFITSLTDSLGRTTEITALTIVDQIYMREKLTEAIDWQIQKGKETVAIDAPLKVCGAVLARHGDWSFPPIVGVISAPTLRADGSLLDIEGYDQATRLYLASTVSLPTMPENPTMADATEALALLGDLLKEFPFVNAASRSVGLSALITPAVRGMLDVAPGHVARAPTAGTGKSYLFDIAAAISIGTRCPVIARCKNDEEMEKRLGAAALAGQPIINFDNVNGELRSDALSQLVTQAICQIRVLGKSEQPSVGNRFCLFASGNNIRITGDLTRRVLLCSMDARIEKPSERQFNAIPVEKVLADRGKYIAACLTIVRAYIEAGRPPVASVPLNGFAAWSNSVRSALLWLGCADPVETISQARDEDPELQLLVSFLEAFKLTFGIGKEFSSTAADIITRSEVTEGSYNDIGQFTGNKMLKYQALHEVLTHFYRGNKVDARYLGRWLLGVKGRIVEGHCLASEEDKHRKVQRWFVDRA